MKAEVTAVAPQPPEQRVVLDLSVEEFAMLDHLRYKHLGGNTSLRDSIDEGFQFGRSRLSTSWRNKVNAAHGSFKGWNSEFVQKVFRGA